MSGNGYTVQEEESIGHGSAICTVEDFVKEDYDFIVVGGGTAGAVVAARLTENSKIKVGVIEAGEDLMDDPNVSTPGLYPRLIGNPKYDWCFVSTIQETAGGKAYSMPRGKLLGGSSGINYLMYIRPARSSLDHWEALGNKGWGWEGMLPYFRKHEKLEETQPHEDPSFMPIDPQDQERYHGVDGPIHVSFNDWYSPFEYDFCQAAYATTGGAKSIKDAWSGDHMGFFSSLGVVNRSSDPGKRSYAATGYLRPNLHRPNLKIITGSHVSRVLLAGSTATGVEFLHNGQRFVANCSQEVVLSAGVIQTPQILELSGIGDPSVLEQAGIRTDIENKAVGANFQDHVLSGLVFDLKPGVRSLNSLKDTAFAKAQQEVYSRTATGPYASPGMLMGFVSYSDVSTPEKLEATIQQAIKESQASTPFEKAQEKLVLDQLRDPDFADLQTFCFGCRLDVGKGHDQEQFFGPSPEGKHQVSLLMCLEHPLSRGSVHIKSADPLQAPAIDPGYFRNEVDAKILAAGIDWLDRVSQHPTFAQYVEQRDLPPPESSILELEEGRIEYLRNHISTQYHIVGTCAMGEALDDRLLVRGTKNIRVIDASVFPTHISGNTLATTYAVAEKGAALVKEDRFPPSVDSLKI